MQCKLACVLFIYLFFCFFSSTCDTNQRILIYKSLIADALTNMCDPTWNIGNSDTKKKKSQINWLNHINREITFHFRNTPVDHGCVETSKQHRLTCDRMFVMRERERAQGTLENAWFIGFFGWNMILTKSILTKCQFHRRRKYILYELRLHNCSTWTSGEMFIWFPISDVAIECIHIHTHTDENLVSVGFLYGYKCRCCGFFLLLFKGNHVIPDNVYTSFTHVWENVWKKKE